jgi:predicted nucleotidyltransferase component of viral defense system
MIKPSEIQQKAQRVRVRDQQIEKDYVLSWILQGIANHVKLCQTVVFKGGTVLKKVYYEDYRFSEDLDFTLLDSSISNEQILEWFREVFDYTKEEANIYLEIITINNHEDGGINFYISYVGPLGGSGAKKKVKVDISRSEHLSFKPTSKPVILGYSDQENHYLLCYTLEEVLVEKLRTVMQRMQARDFYDIWYLLENQKMDVVFLTNEFKEKCEFKGLNPEDFHSKLNQRIPQYKEQWKKSISEQIHDLPDFVQVERETLRQLKKFVEVL